MENQIHLNAVGEIGELLFVSVELEKYEHLGAVASLTEELYFANLSDAK